MKLCNSCWVAKPYSEFYPHSRMEDGFLNKCKECVKNRVKKYSGDNIDRIRKYDRERDANPHRVEARREYQLTHRETCNRAKKAWIQRNPEKRKAHNAVHTALKSGKLIKQTCYCGESKVEAHHKDYSKPLEVTWLCKKHHPATLR